MSRRLKSLTMDKRFEIKEWILRSSGKFLSHYEDREMPWVDKDPFYLASGEHFNTVVVKENDLGICIDWEDTSRMGELPIDDKEFMWCGIVTGFDYA